ncbi:hypothetical protein VNO80_25436 [Phaseolus coccineus]|uniref:PORR domain-containing protein n=1 Tax=Phaseolus coccineus TaxID=3886 RepID=A0AAN9QP04_PHACN
MVMGNWWLGRTRGRYCYHSEFLIRWMTSSRRVQDRSKKKRVHDLEVATEKWKIFSKIIYLMELLKQEPEMVIPVPSLENHRRQINLPKPHRISDFLRKTPQLFELHKDQKGVLWCGMTPKAEDLMEQQQRVIEGHADKVVKTLDGVEFLELVSSNPEWAITELEKKVVGGVTGSGNANARGLKAGSLEFDKRAVAVMHELLSFTIEKRLVSDHLTHFRRELVMPQKLMRLLLKHCGIFYVSERGKRFSVFLTEAYEGSELIEKCPLVLWKEKVLGLVGYRGRKKKFEIDQTGTLDYKDPLLWDDLEMDVGEIG